MAKKIGFIGYGLRSRTMMHAFRAMEANFEVRAITDPREEEIRSETAEDPYFSNVHFCKSAEALLDLDDLDGVFIGTRCSLHTQFACMALERRIPVFLEKPVCINHEQYERLKAAAEGKTDFVVVSFPLRVSPVTIEIRKIVESGMLGQLTMVQAINNVPYGSVYYHSWYRDPRETGGLFLQKATHDLDYIAFLTGQKPSDAFARKAKLYYKGNKPAGLHCPDCAEYHSCVESSYVVGRILKEDVQGDCCCFATDTGNEDVASAIFTYPSGMIVSYSQNFIAKKSAARRGCRIIGTRGSVEFDFYTGVVREDRYDSAQSVEHKFDFGKGLHFGGDEALALEYMNLLDGKKPSSDLAAGLASAAVCLAARESSQSGVIERVRY